MWKGSLGALCPKQRLYFFSQCAYNKPSAELVGALWWESPLTLTRDSLARQQVVIEGAWVSMCLALRPTCYVMCFLPSIIYRSCSVCPLSWFLFSLFCDRGGICPLWGFDPAQPWPLFGMVFPQVAVCWGQRHIFQQTPTPHHVCFLSRSSFPEKFGERLN